MTITPSPGRTALHGGRLVPLLLAATLCVPAAAAAQTRGELLYATHCVACHDTQRHWREKRLAVDWPSLRVQVRQWQAVAQLAWSDDDIEQVVRHLNDRIYHYPPPASAGTVARAAPPLVRSRPQRTHTPAPSNDLPRVPE